MILQEQSKLLSYLGLLPFIFSCILIWIIPSLAIYILVGFIAYSLLIYIFLTGSWWALPIAQAIRYIPILLFFSPFLIFIPSLCMEQLIKDKFNLLQNYNLIPSSLVALICSYEIGHFYELRKIKLNSEYMNLRFQLTFSVRICHFAYDCVYIYVTQTYASKSNQWNNNLAFLLAATGSAVGLGNIWGFPYKAGENGGGLFVLLYLFFVIVLGLPVFMAEVFIGKTGKGNQFQQSKTLQLNQKSSKSWNLVGYAGILASLIIAGYYAVIAGLVVNYGFIAAAGFGASDPSTVYAAGVANFWEMTFWFSAFLVASGIVVGYGIDQGIEKAMRILLPMLFVLVILMVGYGAVRGDMASALNYLFSWKADQFNAEQFKLL